MMGVSIAWAEQIAIWLIATVVVALAAMAIGIVIDWGDEDTSWPVHDAHDRDTEVDRLRDGDQ